MIPAQVNVRDLLFEALRATGRNVTFDKITVKQICENAGVSTRTFYNHFRDKYDLASWGYAHGLKATLAKSGPTFSDQQLASLKVVAEHGSYLNSLFETTHGVDSFRRALREANREIYSARALETIGRTFNQQEIFTLDVYLGGLCEAYIAWWREGMVIPPEELAQWAEQGIPEIIRRPLGVGDI